MWKIDFKKHWIYVVLALGVIVILFGNMFLDDATPAKTGDRVEPTIANIVTSDDYIENLETRLADTLSKIRGVGSVDVMITIHSGSEKILATNEKSSTQLSEGTSKSTQSQRDTQVMVVDNEPLVLTELTPQIEGVVIIADGAESDVVKEQIYQATVALLGVKTHKVAVFPKQ